MKRLEGFLRRRAGQRMLIVAHAAPIALLILLFVGVALINQGLEEHYNPRLRGVTQ